MKVLVFAAFTLFCATVAAGETCKVKVPIRSSALKCEGQTYQRSPEAIAAFNECFKGKNGLDLIISDVNCLFDKLGMSQSTFPTFFKQTFPQHHEAILQGVKDCQAANSMESDLKDPLKHVACHSKLYQEVCKHKTCDWMNSFD